MHITAEEMHRASLLCPDHAVRMCIACGDTCLSDCVLLYATKWPAGGVEYVCIEVWSFVSPSVGYYLLWLGQQMKATACW